MHLFRQCETVILLKDKCGTSFTGLTVDSDNPFVFPPYIMRIDEQIRNIPKRIVASSSFAFGGSNAVLIIGESAE